MDATGEKMRAQALEPKTADNHALDESLEPQKNIIVPINDIRMLAVRNRAHIVEAGRFVVAGLLNTGFSYAIYLILLIWCGYQLAYALSYAAGIGMSYLTNAVFVFRKPIKARSALAFPLVYLAQFILGFLLLKILVDLLFVPVEIAPLIIVAITLPITFLLSRKIITGRFFDSNGDPESSSHRR